MVLNSLVVIQSGSTYYIYTQTNIPVGMVQMPSNGQFAFDTQMLNVITKALAVRWGIIAAPKKI
jgi:hypothetical protein